ncbi:sulfotransferase family protein [Catenovulum agarivorans]|uniref:sulfotransferase family protein n=1 Tax=Catenovulum agarivorans TaxID=1172192 RepID=UPI00059078B5|nr:sulfotransferase [Catenovulum agarivorans]
MHKYNFISGLPRAGSTLLAGLLRQNPDFQAAMSSPVAGLVNTFLEQVGAGSEFYSFFDEAKRKHMARSLFDAYYHPVEDKRIVFDTNRIWTARMHQLAELFDDFKMICCVRNPAWIMDSFERIYRKNPFDYSRIYSSQNRTTVYSRCESLASMSGLFGSSWTALKEAYYGDYSQNMLLVDYDIFVQHPQKTMQLIYQFLSHVPFEHDVDNVDYREEQFDLALGARDLHTVKTKVEFTPRRSILPPELFNTYSEMAFWTDNQGTDASFIG